MKLVYSAFVFFSVVGILGCNDSSHIKTDTALF
jgi:hypothetical protein